MIGSKLDRSQIAEMKKLSQEIWKGRCATKVRLEPEVLRSYQYKKYIDLVIRYFNHN